MTEIIGHNIDDYTKLQENLRGESEKWRVEIARLLEVHSMVGLLTRRHVSTNHGPGCHEECTLLKKSASDLGYSLFVLRHVLICDSTLLKHLECARRMTDSYLLLIQDLESSTRARTELVRKLSKRMNTWQFQTIDARAARETRNEEWLDAYFKDLEADDE
jgi:hypothetical protein